MKTQDFKFASVDIGSNSFLLLLCHANPTGITKIENDIIEIVRLGQGLSTGKKFLLEALERAQKTLERFKAKIDSFQPDVVLAKATAAARIAENSSSLLKIGNDLSLPIEVIPGEQEAKITYQGVFWGRTTAESEYNLLIDIGGASTELIVGRGLAIEFSISLPFGAVLLTERFIKSDPVSADEVQKLDLEISDQIKKTVDAITKYPIKNVIAVAGTPTTLVEILVGKYDAAKIDGFALSIDQVRDLENKLKVRTTVQKIEELKVPKGRADILYAGAVLLRKIIEATKVDQVAVSTRGVRHGIVADYFLSDPKVIR